MPALYLMLYMFIVSGHAVFTPDAPDIVLHVLEITLIFLGRARSGSRV